MNNTNKKATETEIKNFRAAAVRQFVRYDIFNVWSDAPTGYIAAADVVRG